MKIKISILAIIAISLGSCEEPIINYDENVVITKRITSNDIICHFYTNKKTNDFQIVSDMYLSFYDSCGKYNIGDTIRLTK